MDVGTESVKVTGQRVARRIKELRLERSFTLADLAARLAELDRSYTLSTLSRIEQGKRRVDTDDLVALALALDVPPNAILFPPSEHHEATTKLTANIEADTSAVLRWAASGDTDSLGRHVETPGAPDPTRLGSVHRLIVAMDIERSTQRTNPVKAELRHVLYSLLDQALQAAGIGPKHLEPLTDRGDGVLILIRPHDDVPKTLLLDRLVPQLTNLLSAHNNGISPAMEPRILRLRVVVHAGEVHHDGKGFFGDDLEVAFRLLDSRALKTALSKTPTSPLAVMVSNEVHAGIFRHSELDETYKLAAQVRVGNRSRRGWINTPIPSPPSRAVTPARLPAQRYLGR